MYICIKNNSLYLAFCQIRVEEHLKILSNLNTLSKFEIPGLMKNLDFYIKEIVSCGGTFRTLQPSWKNYVPEIYK